jgi:hypothetical protein
VLNLRLAVVDNARVSDVSPLPGSIEEYELRARLKRAVSRGRTVDDPAHAQLAVDLAQGQLESLARQRRWSVLSAPISLVIGVGELLIGHVLLGSVLLGIGIATVITLPFGHRLARSRLERAIRANQELAARAGDQRDH